jgi:hypothetical protein
VRDAARSDYDFLKSMLDSTPNQISPIHSKREVKNRQILLGMKLVECSLRPSALYSFKWHDERCIEIGDPSNDLQVEVRCFDPGDHEFYFLVGARENSGSKISQRNMNQVL